MLIPLLIFTKRADNKMNIEDVLKKSNEKT